MEMKLVINFHRIRIGFLSLKKYFFDHIQGTSKCPGCSPERAVRTKEKRRI